MFLVKINTPVHYHVKKIEFVKTKSVKDQFHFLMVIIMVVSAGMAHIYGNHIALRCKNQAHFKGCTKRHEALRRELLEE